MAFPLDASVVASKATALPPLMSKVAEVASVGAVALAVDTPGKIAVTLICPLPAVGVVACVRFEYAELPTVLYARIR